MGIRHINKYTKDYPKKATLKLIWFSVNMDFRKKEKQLNFHKYLAALLSHLL